MIEALAPMATWPQSIAANLIGDQRGSCGLMATAIGELMMSEHGKVPSVRYSDGMLS